MKDKEAFINRVAGKTNVKKEDIFSLANDLQTKNLNDEKDMREFIQRVAKVANKPINDEKVNKIVSMIKNNKVPDDIEKMV